MFFQGTKHMEIAGRHVRAVGRMVKLLPLELGQFRVCDPGDVWTRRSLLTRSSTLSMRSAVMTVFAWPGLGSSTKLSRPARKRALHFLTDLSDTVFPVYGHHPPMNSGRFNTFRCQKSDNASLLLNRRILQCERHPVLTRTAASIGRRSL